MQDSMYQTPVQDVADLRQRLIDARCKALSTAGASITSGVWGEASAANDFGAFSG